MSHKDEQRIVSRRDLLSMAGMLGIALAMPTGARSLSPALLTESDLALVGEIADIIIPATNTAGAKAAGVIQFAGMMVSDWFIQEERQRFLRGLRAFDKQAETLYGSGFLTLSAQQKQALVCSVLTAAETRTAAVSEPPPFIVLLKRLTVLGYYTSKIGAAEELELNLTPGRYEPCAHTGPEVRAGSTGFRNPTFSAT